MGSGKQLISNTIYLSLTWGSTTIFSFLFWLILGKLVDPWDYGIVSTSTNLMLLLSSISGLGLYSVLIKFISEDKRNIKYLSFSIKIFSVSNLLILFIFLLFNQSISSTLKLNTHTLLISLFGMLLISFSNLTDSVLRGLQKMKTLFLTSCTSQLLKVILCLLFIFLIGSYFGPIIAFAASYIIIIFLRFKFLFLKAKNYSLKNFEKKRMFKYSLSAFGGLIGVLIFTNMQYIILTAFKDPSITGKFTVGMMISKPILVITTVITAALFPIISQFSKNGKSEKQKYFSLAAFRYSLLIIIPLTILLISFSRIAVLIFSSEKYLEAVEFLPLLVIGSMFFALGHLFTGILYASRKPTLFRNILLFSSFLFLSLSLPLVYQFSAIGLSFAFLLSSIIYFILSLIFFKKHIPIKLPLLSTIKIIISSTLILLFLYFLKPFIHNVFLAVLLFIPSIIIYLLSLYILKFYTMQDVKILEFLGDRVPFFGRYILSIAMFLKDKL